VFLSEFMPEATPRSAPAREKNVWNVGDIVSYPIKRLELVLLVHRDVWPGCDFSMVVFEAAGRGQIHFPDPERESSDRLPIEAPITRSAASVELLRAFAVPGYAEILRSLTTPLGWKLEDPAGRPAFQMFKCEIAYPLYSAQFLLRHS
jgi:hypothetical protein